MNMKKILLSLGLVTAVFVLPAGRAFAVTDSVALQTASGTIYGSLNIPAGETKMPVVLIIAGSGPTDRNGNNPVMTNNSLKMLADSLEAHGIASLRYDKRGIGASKAAGKKESDLRFEHYTGDATEWVKLLQKDSRFSSVTILGHSEGSLTGMIAASQSKPAAFISVAGAGESADILLKSQLAKQAPQFADTCNRIIDSLKAGFTVKSVNPVLYSLFRPDVQPYMISWFRYDPQSEIAGLDIPVLILQGTTDIQVSVADAGRLAVANKKAGLKIIDGMNHIMKDAPEDLQQNYATYNNPELPLNRELIRHIVDFITTETKQDH